MSDKLESKLDKLTDEVKGIVVQVAVYNSHLEKHMKRSDALEAIVFRVKSFQDRLMGGFKLLTASGLGAAILKIISLYF